MIKGLELYFLLLFNRIENDDGDANVEEKRKEKKKKTAKNKHKLIHINWELKS